MTYVRFWGNSDVSENIYRQMFVCCALTVLYSTYNTLGQSIASIYNLSGIYINYRPPYCTIYIIIYIYDTIHNILLQSMVEEPRTAR